RVAVPHRPDLAATTAAVVGFVPMFTADSAAINNDALANLLAALSVWMALLLVRDGNGTRRAPLVGLLVGLLLLTKLTVYLFVPLLLGVLAYASARGRAAGDRAAGTSRPAATETGPHPDPLPRAGEGIGCGGSSRIVVQGSVSSGRRAG